RHTRSYGDWSSDVCSSDLTAGDGRLTAFVPVGTGRPLAVRLHQALYAAREAIDYQRATGGMDAFDGAVEAGVSRELTEALVALEIGRASCRERGEVCGGCG